MLKYKIKLAIKLKLNTRCRDLVVKLCDIFLRTMKRSINNINYAY